MSPTSDIPARISDLLRQVQPLLQAQNYADCIRVTTELLDEVDSADSLSLSIAEHIVRGALLDQGLCCNLLERYDEAITVLRRAGKIVGDEHDQERNVLLSNAYAGKKDYETAIDLLEELTEEDEEGDVDLSLDGLVVFGKLGTYRFYRAEYDQALDALERAIDYATSDDAHIAHGYRFLRGLAFESLGDVEAAKAEYRDVHDNGGEDEIFEWNERVIKASDYA